MHFLNKLIPSFLKKLDHHLLLNHRILWETKLHFILFYGICSFLGYTLLGFLYPIALNSSVPDSTTVGLISAIPALILFCYWIYHQVQYSIENNYGKLFTGLAQWRLLIHFVSVFIFFLPALQLKSIVNDRVAALADAKEIEEDILTLNIGNPFYLAHYDGFTGSYSHWESPSVDILDYLTCMENEEASDCQQFNFQYFGRMQHSMYRFYRSYSNTNNVEYKHQFVLYLRSQDIALQEQKLAYIKAFKTVFEKYGGTIQATPTQTYQHFYAEKYFQADLAYQKHFVKNQISMIKRAKRGISDKKFSEATKMSLILAFMFSLALYVFKSVGMKDFIISIVSLTAVAIASIALISFWGQAMRGSILDVKYLFIGYSGSLILFTLFRVISITTKMVYTRFLTVCLVAFTFVTPFLLAWSVAVFNLIGDYNLFTAFNDLLNLILAGICIHICFTLPWLRKKYLRMKALPKV